MGRTFFVDGAHSLHPRSHRFPLAALPLPSFCFSRLPFSALCVLLIVRRSPFAVRRLPFAVCRLPFAVCRLPFAVCRLPFAVCRLPASSIAPFARSATCERPIRRSFDHPPLRPLTAAGRRLAAFCRNAPLTRTHASAAPIANSLRNLGFPAISRPRPPSRGYAQIRIRCAANRQDSPNLAFYKSESQLRRAEPTRRPRRGLRASAPLASRSRIAYKERT
ncbi:hypothetical protein [Burkholderia savannae]|uniref:hypothetical protein n=1 Tax=Burkholderia savannae TaxID=1637837 RepID=UPI0012E3B94C|nr:hypothetical protein [Burkholderia savannae]